MKNLIVLGLFVFGVCFVNNVFAEEDGGDPPKKEKKAKKPKAPKPEIVEITISGTVSKLEKKNKKGDVSFSYLLTDLEGNKIKLPTPKAPKKTKKSKPGEAPLPAVNLEDFVDAKVTLMGKGYGIEKKGKKLIVVKSITSVAKTEE